MTTVSLDSDSLTIATSQEFLSEEAKASEVVKSAPPLPQIATIQSASSGAITDSSFWQVSCCLYPSEGNSLPLARLVLFSGVFALFSALRCVWPRRIGGEPDARHHGARC
jgi:hypothetical protein